MKLQLSLAVSALAIFAASCSKEKIAPNAANPASPGGDLHSTGDVIVFDHSGPQSIAYGTQSDDAGVVTSTSTATGTSTQEQQFDPTGGGGNSTGVIPGTVPASENAVFVIP